MAFPQGQSNLLVGGLTPLIERSVDRAPEANLGLCILPVVFSVGDSCFSSHRLAPSGGTRGLVVEYNVAIVVTRVRFPAGAFVTALGFPRRKHCEVKMVLLGLEPRAFRLLAERSDQLSYKTN